MSKKDFIALADSLRGVDVSPAVLNRLCEFCRSRNPKFDERLWRAYLVGDCGPNGGAPRDPNKGAKR